MGAILRRFLGCFLRSIVWAMGKPYIITGCIISGIGLLLAACSAPFSTNFSGLSDFSTVTSATPSSLAPKGPGATQIANLWWLMLGLGTSVYLLVAALLLGGLLRRRSQANSASATLLSPLPARTRNIWLIGGGVILPSLVLMVVFGATVWVMRATANTMPPNALVIEVTGHQWWWSVRYPEQQFTTANELHIPVGRPVAIKLTSADVIHSFWVAELHGKLDLMPGHTNTLVLQADQPGEFRGLCAEFCGLQHAKMMFVVVAEPPEQFAAWLQNEQQPAAEPTDALAIDGKQVFLASKCVQCHAVSGTPAVADVGPDLTHLASRRTLAAALLPNTRGHLAGWIVNPQHLKPGNEMPNSDLAGQDLQALLAYLEGLK